MTSIAERATAFAALHAGPKLLVLPNAWDAGSARIIESAGAKAIATSSAAVAWAHGYPDGQYLPFDTLLAAVREITRVVTVPVSADIEAAYAHDAATAATTVARVVDAGAVGINIEDGNDPPDLLARKIENLKAAARRR
jgi:2-methylisocitrate lyase-like PEP mutase family enzyme